MERWSWLAVAVLWGCGGSTNAHEPARETPGAPGGNASAGSGTIDAAGSGGTAGAAGAAGMAGGNTGGNAGGGAPKDLALGADGFPLMVDPGLLLNPDADGLYVVRVDETGELDVGTHVHHLDLTRQFSSVLFDAKASSPVELLVCLTPIVAPYPTEIASGYAWQCSSVPLGTELASYSVVFAQMIASGSGEARPLTDASGSQLHFLLVDAAELELTLRSPRLHSEPTP
jgi:hypothetical protein